MSAAIAPAGPADVTGLPAGWVARRIPAGVWLFEEPEPAAARAAELRWPVPDPARPIVVVDGRGGSALEAASAAVRSLAEQGAPRRVRLVLPGLSPFAAQRFADRQELDVVATSGAVRVGRSHLYTWGFDAERPASFWQWFRFVPGRRPEPFGAIHPSPAWEAALIGAGAVPARLGGLVPYRIAAGLALLPGGPADVTFLGHAAGIRPDLERITVAVSANHGEAAVARAVGDLLAALPATRRMRLVCPSSAANLRLRELVRRYDAELVAPDAGIVQDPESGALLTSGPHGLGRWVRMTANRPAESLGPLHPLPSWRPALRTAPTWGDDLVETASGIRLVRPCGSSAVRVAAAVPPDPERITIAADGDPGRPADREALERLIASLPDDLRASFRLVMADAGQGGPRAYGQWLANRFHALIAVVSGVPAVAWEPTAPAVAVTSPSWQEFGPEPHPAFPPNRLLSPREGPPEVRPDARGTPLPARPPAPTRSTMGPDADVLVLPRRLTPRGPATPPAPRPAPPATADGPGPVPPAAGDASRVPDARSPVRDVPVHPLVPRDHQSTPEERRRYRERIGSRWERHLVAVSRLANERPALRSVMTAGAGAADLSALRAYLCGDLPGLDAALRAGDAVDLRAEVACCVSGLRLLAAHRGPAYRTADLTDDEAARHRPGDVLAEPAFTAATAAHPRAGGNTLYAIWSRTARRVAPLAAGGDPDALLFAAGTAFAVLAAGRDEEGRWVVHLDECLRPRRPGMLTGADRRVLDGLRAAATEAAEDAPDGHGPPLGLGDRCRYVPS